MIQDLHRLTAKGISRRSRYLLVNITASFVVKGWAALVILLMVPLTLDCLGTYQNGVWLTISSLLFVSASYTPLPGASGAQEGGFLLYFRDIFKDGTIGLALLIWRFFTFYLYLIVGVFTIILEKIILRREARKRKNASKAA